MAVIAGPWVSRALVVSLLVLVGGSVRAGTAAADADPASDVLLVQNAFLPYEPTTPPVLAKALNQALTEIHSTGLQLKVAIIGSPVDLGGIPDLFGQVSRYAAFLETEISYRGPQPLLVVMPDGLSLQAAGSASALTGLAVDAHQQSAGLARTAVLAVERIAAARGHPIAAPALGASGGGGSGGLLLSVVAVAAVLLVIGGGFAVRRRRSNGPGVPSRP
jgi:GNAT superfamily N-acetyltransferase